MLQLLVSLRQFEADLAVDALEVAAGFDKECRLSLLAWVVRP